MRTIWLTGISGAGKSTIAKVYRSLYNPHLVIIDGDEIRKTINSHLGFDSSDRDRNVETCAKICKLLNDDGHLVIASITSPTEQQREKAEKIIGKDKMFLVYVSCPLETAISRDPKGLYSRYYKGEITNMVGIDIPFQVPDDADLTLNTDFFDVNACVTTLRDSFHKSINKK